MISDAILSLIIGSVAGVLILLIKVIHNSKCQSVKCCCITCLRDTVHEVEIPIQPSQI